MNQLLRFEFRKLLRQKSYYICLGTSFLFLFLNAVIAQQFSSGKGPAITGFDSLQGTIGGLSFTLLLSISVALFISDDYAGGTIKNVFAKFPVNS